MNNLVYKKSNPYVLKLAIKKMALIKNQTHNNCAFTLRPIPWKIRNYKHYFFIEKHESDQEHLKYKATINIIMCILS